MSTADNSTAKPAGLEAAFSTVLSPPKKRAAQRKRGGADPNSGSPKNNKRPQASPGKLERMAPGLDWPTVIWLALIHVSALAAPFYLTWQGVVLAVVLHWFAGGIGVCLGYHRLLTHGSFQCPRFVRLFLAFVGGFSGEGSAIDWVSNHRKHHALSDQDGDPHSPHDGAWWAHAYWLAWKIKGKGYNEHIYHWAPDVAKDRGMRIISMLFLPTHILTGLLLLGVGYYFGGWYLGISLLVWGLSVRMVAVLHATWLVNSASHMWGYRNYTTTDDSRNNWWVALITYGEGWHNNHHAYPRMANHGHKWWEFDMTFMAIRVLQRLGLAWDVVDYKHRSEKAA